MGRYEVYYHEYNEETGYSEWQNSYEFESKDEALAYYHKVIENPGEYGYPGYPVTYAKVTDLSTGEVIAEQDI